MDNLSSHKGPEVRRLIESVGTKLLSLPPYSPDFNPIETAFAKLKADPRKAARRTLDALWSEIGRLLEAFHRPSTETISPMPATVQLDRKWP